MERYISLILAAIFVAALLAYLWGYWAAPDQSDDLIRIGYMNTWAEGAFPVEVMKKTDILKENQVKAEFFTFPSGAPITEAALSDSIDVGIVAHVPAFILMSKSDKWFIAARLAYFPLSIMARNDSGIKDISGLKGKRIGLPFGTNPYGLINEVLYYEGLDSKKDVTLINMKPTEMGPALKEAAVDAVIWGNPLITVFRRQDIAYPIKEYEELGVVMMSKEFARKHPALARRFLTAFKQSNLFIARDKESVMRWFSEDSGIDLALVREMRLIEPNYKAANLEQVDLRIPESRLNIIQKRIDIEFNSGVYDKRGSITDAIDWEYLQ